MGQEHATEIVGLHAIDGGDGIEWGERPQRVVCSCGYVGAWTTLGQALDDRWLHETLAPGASGS
jgi:hypothetical protein